MNTMKQPRHARRIQSAPTGPAARQIGPRSLRAGLAALSATALLGTGVAFATIGNLNDSLTQAGNLDLGQQSDGATDILLVGLDSRTDAQGNPLTPEEVAMLRAGDEEATNTDTMILIRVPNDGSSATAVSLPRDTYVSTPTMGNMKLNGVYGAAKFEKEDQLEAAGMTDLAQRDKQSTEAGRQALIASVADLTGIHVDHYAEVGLLGFVLLTDAVGGVDVCLNEAVNEPLSGANFPAGYQTLNGPDALSFVRQRHDLPRGDLDRITRQQVYMASLASHILSSQTLTDPSALSRLSQAVQRSVVLDNNWDVMGLATQMQNLAGGNVTFQTIPVTSIDGVGDYGESIVTVDKKQVHAFFDTLLNTAPAEDPAAAEAAANADIPTFIPAETTVTVHNAGEVPGLAARVGDLVRGYGYAIGDIGNAPETGVSESQVNSADPNDPAARALARQLGGLPVVEDPSLPAHTLTVTLSGTYSGPGLSEGASAPLLPPNDPHVGTHTVGMKDLDGDGIPDDDTAATTTDPATGAEVTQDPNLASPSDPSSTVGTPGEMGPGPQHNQEINAGSRAPMCVN